MLRELRMWRRLQLFLEVSEYPPSVNKIDRCVSVDALMVGTGDLRCSMGLEVGSQDGDEPVFLEALEKIQRAADANGLAVLGFAMTNEILERRLKLGWRALVIHSDGAGVFKSGTKNFEDNVLFAHELQRQESSRLNKVNGTNGVGKVNGTNGVGKVNGMNGVGKVNGIKT
jgi:hypothetical protein